MKKKNRVSILIVICFSILPAFASPQTSQPNDVDTLLKTIERYESLVEQVLTIVQAKKAAQEKEKNNQEDAAEK